MQANQYRRDKNYGEATTGQGNEVCLIVEVVRRHTMLILVLIESVWMIL